MFSLLIGKIILRLCAVCSYIVFIIHRNISYYLITLICSISLSLRGMMINRHRSWTVLWWTALVVPLCLWFSQHSPPTSTQSTSDVVVRLPTGEQQSKQAASTLRPVTPVVPSAAPGLLLVKVGFNCSTTFNLFKGGLFFLGDNLNLIHLQPP